MIKNVPKFVIDILHNVYCTESLSFFENYDRNMTDLMIKEGVIAFIGPDETCLHEALVASAWNLPLISYVNLTKSSTTFFSILITFFEGLNYLFVCHVTFYLFSRQSCADIKLTNKTLFPTFARTSLGPPEKISKSVISLLKAYHWKKFIIVADSRQWMKEITLAVKVCD